MQAALPGAHSNIPQPLLILLFILGVKCSAPRHSQLDGDLVLVEGTEGHFVYTACENLIVVSSEPT